jgi:hypothetical protein
VKKDRYLEKSGLIVVKKLKKALFNETDVIKYTRLTVDFLLGICYNICIMP